MDLALQLKQLDFDQETAALVMKAFDEVWDIMQAANDPLVAIDRVTVTRLLLAQHLIEMARQGERDLDRLIDGAMERLYRN